MAERVKLADEWETELLLVETDNPKHGRGNVYVEVALKNKTRGYTFLANGIGNDLDKTLPGHIGRVIANLEIRDAANDVLKTKVGQPVEFVAPEMPEKPE